MLKILLFSLLGFLLLRFAVRLLAKILGILLIGMALVLFAYQKGIGPFERNYFSLKELEKIYCTNENDPYSCDCIVQIIAEDLRGRFSAGEMQEMENDRIKGAYALHRSLNARRKEIEACLITTQNTGKLKEFELSLYTYNNSFMRNIGGVFDMMFRKAGGVWDDLKSEKKTVDERY